jgi:hypothetical protein
MLPKPKSAGRSPSAMLVAFLRPPTLQLNKGRALAFLQGGMQVTVGGQSYRCQAGDKLLIPGNIEHSAVVDPGGCVYFWSEKIV